MFIFSMDTQTRMDLAHREFQEQSSTEAAVKMREEEKEFLKDLYTFMKNKDTPIERIPNLGFKQIDLYVLYTTVRDLGGYHQVTSQQLWKQVYNMLGGNPRSTSAATCTRRHYEKLLLPYECHVKGVSMTILSCHQSQKHYGYANHSKGDDGQRPAKRKLLSIPLRQNPHIPELDRHGGTFPLQLHYPRYYHPSPAALPPSVPNSSSSVLTPQSAPAPEPRFSFKPYPPNPTERVTEPLEHLRFLAERYKTSSGLTEPLNLSIKAPRRETTSNTASSFSPPSSSKNPKFLNKPSPLYTPSPQGVRSETKDSEEGSGDSQHSYPVKAGEAYVIDVDALSTSSSWSPTYDPALTPRTEEDATRMPQNPSSPKTDFTFRQKEEREGSPEAREVGLGHMLPGISRENGGEMEIEIPLSVFHNWLRLCSSSAAINGDKQLPPLPTLEDQSRKRKCPDTDILPTNLTFRTNLRCSAAEDLRLKQRLPSPTPTIQTMNQSANHPNTGQNPLAGYKPLPLGGILENAASRDVYQFQQQDFYKLYNSKPANCWDAYDQETQTRPFQATIDSNPLTVQQRFAPPKCYNGDIVQGGKSEMGPSAAVMMNSGSPPLLHLTTEEIVKLKKIISSTS